MGEEIDSMRRWVGRTETRRDSVTARLVDAWRATVADRDGASRPGEPVEPGLHWCLATPDAATSALGPDGHPTKGGFLPPIPAPRRMWAGSTVEFLDPLRVGDEVERVSTVAAVDLKDGRSGRLWFVAVDHHHATARGVAVRERQDIVYRGEPAAATPPEPEPDLPESPFDDGFATAAGSALLFRYSALTFNAHRIHYDLAYAQDVEKYQGLVVHGPLQASLLLRLACRMGGGVSPARFSFRGMRPLIAGGEIACRGVRTGADGVELWTGRSREAPYMRATASW